MLLRCSVGAVPAAYDIIGLYIEYCYNGLSSLLLDKTAVVVADRTLSSYWTCEPYRDHADRMMVTHITMI